jgi:two-component system, NarL family, sensor histidine kinase UhpB
MPNKHGFVPRVFGKISCIFWEFFLKTKISTVLATMSLRFRLICLVVITLVLSLAVEWTIVFFNASRSVRTEISAALQVGEQISKSALRRLPESSDPRRGLEELVAAFKGNRHLRVSLSGSTAALVEPPLGDTHFGVAPSWFARLLAITPLSAELPAVIAGRDYGTIVIEADPKNEVLEVWNSLGDSLLTLLLFFSLSILLTYYFIGCALRPLDRLAAAIEKVGHGDYEVRIGGDTVPEVAQLQHSYNRMALELKASDEEKHRLNERLLTLQEEERAEIARDLHDEVSPFLFAVNADLASISRLAEQGRGAEIAGQIRSTLDAVSHMQRQIKTLLLRLRPGVLADFGLSPAIMNIVIFWQRRRPEIRFHVSLPQDSASFGSLIDKTAYRIVQEGLSNAVRHGEPTEISIAVTPSSTNALGPECLTVEVSNDGAKMEDGAGLGFGLTGMRERVQALGGQLVIARKPGLSLSLTATLPLMAPSGQSCASSIAGSA